MTKAIKATVSILTPLSDAASLVDVVGLVCQKTLMACSTSPTFFQTSFPPAKAIQVGIGILLDVWVPFSSPCVNIVVTPSKPGGQGGDIELRRTRRLARIDRTLC